jgi:hypothetical protein
MKERQKGKTKGLRQGPVFQQERLDDLNPEKGVGTAIALPNVLLLPGFLWTHLWKLTRRPPASCVSSRSMR